MHHRIVTAILASLFFTIGFSSCSYMTAQGRREAAYRHYVNKHMSQRQKQLAKAQKAANRKMKHQLQPQPMTEPVVTSSVDPVDEVAAPISVSSSNIAQAPEP